MKEYIPVTAAKIGNSQTTHIKVEVYYTLGGYNYFTYRKEARGYYVSVCPVERREARPGIVLESFTCFTGYKALVKEVSRKSAKAEKEAEQEAAKITPEMIRRVCAEYGLQIIGSDGEPVKEAV
jgi:hypothetical protein